MTENQQLSGDDPFVDFDAPYVLGALSEHDRLAFEDHLTGCPACRERVADLQALPGLLAGVPREAVEALQPAADVIPLQPAERRRPRPWVLAAAGIAVAASMVTAIAVVATRDDPTPAPSEAPVAGQVVELVPVAGSALTASVRLTPVDWGTRIELTCSLPPGEDYGAGGSSAPLVLVVRDRDGRDEQVAAWLGLPDRTLRVPGSTAVLTDDIAEVEIRAPDGSPILAAEL